MKFFKHSHHGSKSTPHDLFVLQLSGLPLYAVCSCGPGCEKCTEQHDLQSGFIAAIVSFCQEVFKRSRVKAILLDDFQLNLKVDENNGLIVAATHDASVPRKLIARQLARILDVFLSKYQSYLEEGLVRPELFESFGKDLYELGIIASEGEITSIIEQQQLTNRHQHDKPTLWKWLKNTFNRPRDS